VELQGGADKGDGVGGPDDVSPAAEDESGWARMKNERIYAYCTVPVAYAESESASQLSEKEKDWEGSSIMVLWAVVLGGTAGSVLTNAAEHNLGVVYSLGMAISSRDDEMINVESGANRGDDESMFPRGEVWRWVECLLVEVAIRRGRYCLGVAAVELHPERTLKGQSDIAVKPKAYYEDIHKTVSSRHKVRFSFRKTWA
jgi:hypothetical protein